MARTAVPGYNRTMEPPAPGRHPSSRKVRPLQGVDLAQSQGRFARALPPGDLLFVGATEAVPNARTSAARPGSRAAGQPDFERRPA